MFSRPSCSKIKSVVARSVTARSLPSTCSISRTTTTTTQKRSYQITQNSSKKIFNTKTFMNSTRTFQQYAQINQSQVRRYADAKEVTVRVPEMGDSITEGTILNWLVQPGEQAKEDDIVCQIETDKVTADVRSPHSGVVGKHFAEKGTTVGVGSDLFSINVGATADAGKPDKKEEEGKKEVEEKGPVSPKATPEPKPAKEDSVRDEKKQEQQPKQQQQQSAPAQQQQQQKSSSSSSSSTPASSKSSSSSERGERRVPMARIRLRIAERLKDSQNTYAMLTTFNEIDMTNIMALRTKYQDEFVDRHKIKLGFMSAFVCAATQALKEFPVVNAVIDGSDILYRDYIDISVAVATPTGLVVPVLRNCESKSFADVEKNIYELGDKAKKNAITLPEMQGGTFTISNGGVFGSLFGTPIINPPQSAILGMHGTFKRAVVLNDQVVARPMMYIALTYDHRIIDGREAVLFLKRVKSLVEEPQQLLLV